MIETGLDIREGFSQFVMTDIAEAYKSDDRPWIVGFSGGKDSTALLQMIYYTIARFPSNQKKKPIYVLASDTRVEIPAIAKRIEKELRAIQLSAERDGLPITTQLVYPTLNDTFWVNLVGRGYPSPNIYFRWCTDRLKIKPISAFIQNVVSRAGDVVVVLGARKSESATRAQTMSRHEIIGNRFRPHVSLLKAWVYTPIEDLSSNEVWTYLLQVPSPWNGNNRELITLYKNASGECPLVIDESTPSCGHSRFGCWTCTVIDKDKSISALVEAGGYELAPLLELRNYLKDIRDKEGYRYNHRRNGATPLRRGTSEIMLNTGPFTHEVRVDILQRLLQAQNESGITLIEGDELSIIQEIWTREENKIPSKPNIPSNLVSHIIHNYNEVITMDNSIYDHLSKEDQILKAACDHLNVPFEMMLQLRNIEEDYGRLKRRFGLPEDMRETIKKYANEI